MSDFVNLAVKEKCAMRSLEKPHVCEADRALIMKYAYESPLIKPVTRYHMITALSNWRRYIPVPYDQLTADSLRAGTRAINEAKNTKGAPYAVNAKNTMYRVLKAFVRWLVDEGVVKINARDIKKILKSPAYIKDVEKAADMLTVDEVNTLIAACSNARDRCLFAVLYESGARISEVARMRWKDLVFDVVGGVETSIWSSKTEMTGETTRTTWLQMAHPYLSVWKASYPGVVNQDALVFISRRGQYPTGGLSYTTIVKILRDVVRKAGIKKRVHLHLFRKSRATQMAREGYGDATIKRSLWGRESSQMADVYIKLAAKDVLDDMRRQGGVLPREKPQPPLAVKCIVCGETNPVGAESCVRCGRDPYGRPSEKPEDAMVRQIAAALVDKPEVKAIISMIIAGESVKLNVPIARPAKTP